MATTTNVKDFKINYLTEAQYAEAKSGGTLDSNQIYMTPETTTENNTLVVPITISNNTVTSTGANFDTAYQAATKENRNVVLYESTTKNNARMWILQEIDQSIMKQNLYFYCFYTSSNANGLYYKRRLFTEKIIWSSSSFTLEAVNNAIYGVPMPTAAGKVLTSKTIGSGTYDWEWTTPTTYSAATSSTLGLVKIGSNITNSSGTISLSKTNVTNALGYTPPTTNTTYSNATTSTAGLMSSTDKSKLDGIATGATKITVDSSLSASSTNPVQNKVVYSKNLWLYKGTASVSKWTSSSGTYKQTVTLSAVDGGPAITSSSNLSTPMTTQSSSSSTNESLQAALSCINAGYCVPGSGNVAITVWEKPSCDITVYWYAR
nr:MAG TPA: hypothetical protein [Caudoviricetes sp.]